MRYVDMHRIGHNGCHQCAPKAWRIVPNLTGDSDLDASIGHSANRDMARKLSMYISRQHYGPRSAYESYDVGDD